MEIAVIALLAGSMQRDVGDHAACNDVLRNEVPHQPLALIEVEFMRQGTIPAGYFGDELLLAMKRGAPAQ